MNNNNKFDVLAHISEEQRAVLKWQEENNKDAFNTVGVSLDEIRGNYTKERAFWNEGGPVMLKSVDVQVPYEDATVLTRIHYPSANPNLPILFYLHGGGFVVGNLDTHDRIMRILAEQSGCAVIGVHYSLSPEAKFPRALLECAAVTEYYRSHSGDYGLDGNRVAYAGDSGGAHLSFAVTLWLRDHSEDTSYIKALLLYYGLYGLSDAKSMRLYGGSWDGLTEEDLAFYRYTYAATEDDHASPYYCFYNNDLTYRIPPCFIAPSEFDPLLDDSDTLHTILKAHGMPCEYKVYEGTVHAFLHYSKMMKAAMDAMVDGAVYLKKYI